MKNGPSFRRGGKLGPVGVVKGGKLQAPNGYSFITCPAKGCNYHGWLLLTQHTEGLNSIDLMVCAKCGETRQTISVPDEPPLPSKVN